MTHFAPSRANTTVTNNLLTLVTHVNYLWCASLLRYGAHMFTSLSFSFFLSHNLSAHHVQQSPVTPHKTNESSYSDLHFRVLQFPLLKETDSRSIWRWLTDTDGLHSPRWELMHLSPWTRWGRSEWQISMSWHTNRHKATMQTAADGSYIYLF